MYKISSSIAFNLFVFAIFIIFGISLLGAFEISLPSSWSNKLDSKANTNSFGGIFFMALVLVVVSFSCTSAFISMLIVDIVQVGNRLGGVIGFLGFGLALALPFALFAYFPGLLNSLAKSGGWLNSVKVTMGFVELGLAMKFLSNVDLQYHWGLLNYDVYISIWIVSAFRMMMNCLKICLGIRIYRLPA
jgi:thiol:disulfide interchange protein DsbD